MGDAEMQDVSQQAEGVGSEPNFSNEEQEILDLYDQVQKLELELALTNARVRLASKPNTLSRRVGTRPTHTLQTKASPEETRARTQSKTHRP